MNRLLGTIDLDKLKMKLAPIVYFVYNRPQHTKKSLDYLKKNKLAKKSTIYIFSDAPKNKQSKNQVAEVRKVIHNLKGFKKKKIITRKKILDYQKTLLMVLPKSVINMEK